MKKINNKGFTLVELIATVVILSLVVTIGATSITTIIKNAKEKDYELLIKEIKNATEEFYIECNFASNDSIANECPNKSADGYYHIKLIDLINTGFLKGNYTDASDNFTLVNPQKNQNISNCPIKYKYKNGNIVIIDISGNEDYCPDKY